MTKPVLPNAKEELFIMSDKADPGYVAKFLKDLAEAYGLEDGIFDNPAEAVQWGLNSPPILDKLFRITIEQVGMTD